VDNHQNQGNHQNQTNHQNQGQSSESGQSGEVTVSKISGDPTSSKQQTIINKQQQATSNNQAAKQSNNQTTKQPSSQAAKQPTTKQPNTTKQPSSKPHARDVDRLLAKRRPALGRGAARDLHNMQLVPSRRLGGKGQNRVPDHTM
jgi:hypothetical protein